MTDNDIINNKTIDINLNNNNNNDMILSSYEDQQQSIKSSLYNHNKTNQSSRSNNLDQTQNDTNTMKLF